MKIDYEPPNADLNAFSGRLQLTKDPIWEVLTTENFIPRGSINKTGWIYGLVLYTGMDTKIMKNSNYSKSKLSYLDLVIEKLFYFTFFFVALFSAISIIILLAKSKDIKFILGNFHFN